MPIQLHKRIFERFLSSQLIYNQCWEDYALDQSALRIGPGDRIVTITSAGCNALNYLLFDPAALNCARKELQSGGRIGIVDFCSVGNGQLARLFAAWCYFRYV